MKLSKKVKKQLLRAVHPLLDHSAKTGETILRVVYRREKDKSGRIAFYKRTSPDPLPVYVNHKRRLRTIMRNATSEAELKQQMDRHIGTYPAIR